VNQKIAVGFEIDGDKFQDVVDELGTGLSMNFLHQIVA